MNEHTIFFDFFDLTISIFTCDSHTKLIEKTLLLKWLLGRIRPREFDPNKQYASELLAILVQVRPTDTGESMRTHLCVCICDVHSTTSVHTAVSLTSTSSTQACCLPRDELLGFRCEGKGCWLNVLLVGAWLASSVQMCLTTNRMLPQLGGAPLPNWVSMHSVCEMLLGCCLIDSVDGCGALVSHP